MEVVLFQLSKRNKSSLRPSGEGLVLNLQLKDECDLEHPEFVLYFEPTNYNYCYIPTWNRYYFKGKQQYFHGRWFVKFNEDYLATWLTDIRNTRAYVLYDVNTYDIPDSRIPALATPTQSVNRVLMRSDFNTVPLADEGTYVVTVTGENGVSSYTILGSQMNRLLINFTQWFDTLYDSSSYSNWQIGQCFVELMKQILGTGSAAQNIKSCIWLPMSVQTSESEEIHLGLYDTNLTCGKLGINPLRYETTNISIPWQVNDWRRNTPYTQLYLYIPHVGLINYPTSDLIGIDQLQVESCVNCATGEMSVLVKAGNEVLGTYGANISASIPIGSSGIVPSNVITSVVKAGATMAKGSGLGAAVAAGTDILSGLEPISSTIGGMGGGTASKFSNNLECITIYHDTIVEPSSVVDIIGAPSMFVKSLADASGFIQTAGFQLGGIATAPEKDAVNSLMDSGVYLE